MKVDFLKSLLIATSALFAVAGPSYAQGVRADYAPVTAEMLANPPAEEWLMYRGAYNNQGYSQLDMINKDTVGDLELAWAWPMAEAGIQETAPLVHDGVMFLQTNNNIVEALDAKTGDLIWQYRHVLPEIPATWSYQANQARRQKNSIALWDDKVILTTVDAKIVVLNAADGKVAWEKQVLDYNLGYSYTVGPLIADGKTSRQSLAARLPAPPAAASSWPMM